MAPSTICNLQNFFKSKIINAETRSVNLPGQNYGGSVMALKLILEKGNDVEELNLITKKLFGSEFIKAFSNIQFVYRNELNFYEKIIPILVQRSEGINNIFPKFFGGRLNLTKKLTVDNDAVILLEDLQTKGFVHIDINKGFNLEEIKTVLVKISDFHAASLGIKLENPNKFDELFNPFLSTYLIRLVRENEDLRVTDERVNSLIKKIQANFDFKEHLDDITEVIKKSARILKNPKNSEAFTKTPFSAIIHGDLWMNNIMVKYEKDKLQDIRIFDLQNFEHASIINDLLYFIFLSANDQVLEKHFNNVIFFYFENLVENLRKQKISTPSFEMFKEEVKRVAIEQYVNIAGSTQVIFPSSVYEESLEDFLAAEPSPLGYRRTYLITKKYLAEKWI